MTARSAILVTSVKTSAIALGTSRRVLQTPVAAAVVVVPILVFIATWLLTSISPHASHSMETILANSPPLVRERLWLWQLLTASFLHTNAAHLLLTVLPLAWLVSRLERSLGSLHVLLFCILSAVFAYAVYDLADSFLPLWDPTSGASGSLYAAAVLFVLRFPQSSFPLTDRVRLPLWWLVLGFVALDISWFFWPVTMPWVNRIVHLGGAVFGVLWWAFLVQKDSVYERH